MLILSFWLVTLNVYQQIRGQTMRCNVHFNSVHGKAISTFRENEKYNIMHPVCLNIVTCFHGVACQLSWYHEHWLSDSLIFHYPAQYYIINKHLHKIYIYTSHIGTVIYWCQVLIKSKHRPQYCHIKCVKIMSVWESFETAVKTPKIVPYQNELKHTYMDCHLLHSPS